MAQLKGPSRIKVSRLYEWVGATVDQDFPSIAVAKFQQVCKSHIYAERELAETQELLARAQRENLTLRQALDRIDNLCENALAGRADVNTVSLHVG